MKTIHPFKSSRLIQAAVVSVSLSLGSSAFALGPIEHSYLIDPTSRKATDLGSLGGDTYATALNDAGQVVGHSTTAMGDTHAFVTGPNGVGMTDLNSLVSLPNGVVLTEATAINNVGQVVAISTIPEPASYALMLVGLGLLDFMASGRKAGEKGSGVVSSGV